MTAGLVLVIVALAMIVYNGLVDHGAEVRTNATVGKLEQIIPTSTSGQPQIGAYSNTGTVSSASMPVLEVDGKSYVGIIEIASLKVKLPVLDSWSEEEMHTAPCRYAGVASEGKFILGGYSYSSMFGHLNSLGINDKVVFTDVHGATYAYSVTGIETVPRRRMDLLEQGSWTLTLFTYTADKTAYTTVRCVLDK